MEAAYRTTRGRGISMTSFQQDIGFGGTLFRDVEQSFASLHEREENEET